MKIRIDGVEFEAPDQTAQAFGQKITALDAQIETLTAENGKLAGKADALVAECKKRDDALKVARDPKTIAKLVADRVELVSKARAVCGEDFKADGLTDRDVKIAVVTKAKPTMKLDGKSDEYVTAVFDTCSAEEIREDEGEDALADARRAMNPRADEDEDKGEKHQDAREKFMQDSQNAWKQPLPATAKRNGVKAQ